MTDQFGVVFREGYAMHVHGIDGFCKVVSIHDDKSIDVKTDDGEEITNVPFENYITGEAAMFFIKEIVGTDNESVNVGDKVKINTESYGVEEAEKIDECESSSTYRGNDGVLFIKSKE